MFTRPTGLSSCTAQALAATAAKKEQEETALSVLERCKSICNEDEGKIFIDNIIAQCQGLFTNLANLDPTNQNQTHIVQLKSKAIAATTEITQQLTHYTADKRGAIEGHEQTRLLALLSYGVSPLLHKQVNLLFANFVNKATPPDDPEFYNHLRYRTEPKVVEAKKDCLASIKRLMIETFGEYAMKKTLLCHEESLQRSDAAWVDELKHDLREAHILARSIQDETMTSSPARFMDGCINGSALPHAIVTIGTDTLHQRKISTKTCTSMNDEIWHYVFTGARASNRKIIAIQLGSNPSFWPLGKPHQSDNVEDLLTMFPVAKRGYFSTLFDIIYACLQPHQKQAYREILNHFSHQVREFSLYDATK